MVTTDLVEAFLKCRTKCYLRATRNTEAGNVYADWIRRRSEFFQAEGIRRLLSEVPREKCSVGPLDMATGKAVPWKLAVHCEAHAGSMQSSCHVVERIPSSGRGRASQFVPIRFVFANKVSRDDKLLLAFDALVLSKALNREVGVGRIVYGDSHLTANVNTAALKSEMEKLVGKIEAMISSPAPPELVLNRHCVECEFQQRCRQLAIDRDDFSLLGGMTETERTGFNSKGIFTVAQLSFTFRPRRRPKELRNRRERYHYSLKALAIREKKLHIVGTPQITIEGTPVYLDVEGLPHKDFYYLIGLRVKVADSVIHQSLWADSPSDESRIWRAFLSRLSEIENPVLIHYGSFESVFLKRMSDKYGGPPDGSRAAAAIEASVNLVSTIFAQIYFPTYSNSLKDIAGCLGFKWSNQGASGVQAILWRDEWEHTRATWVKEKLITYNAEDCAALELVSCAVEQACQHDIGPRTGNHLEVVTADQLGAKLTMWPKFNPAIEAFDAINKAARWNYQRERIYLRTDASLKRHNPKIRTRTKRAGRISKVVVSEQLPVCPRCQRKTARTPRKLTKYLHDLRFSRTGITGWIVKYQFQVFWCPRCRLFTPWPKEFWDRTAYGRNLAAFAIFEIIQLGVSQRSVTESLNRLFGFQMDEIVVRRFKERGAEYYRETRKKILAAMVEGAVIHADETRIRLHGKTAYVWVFATFHEVAYFYSETREGSLAQSLLDGFNGVLVSDFYAAYDTMPCPQQKCLLHLMRDLNNDVLDNPYDESMKRLATGFAELLREIVKTIDRWGLKSRFLRKHRVDVARFYKRISRTEPMSPAASKWKARLDRERDKLFTFLSRDGVPWNNNNAEHAIKAFARLRRTIEGLSTPKGIEEYLILLSVCQSCKYSGLDFLGFLRSGETDIRSFAAKKRQRNAVRTHQPGTRLA